MEHFTPAPPEGLSKSELLDWKIKNDIPWYMSKFLKIRNKKSQLVPFVVNDAQKTFIDIIEKDKAEGKPGRYIILKARQLGMSTFSEGYIFHDVTNFEMRQALIIAHEAKATSNIFNMSKLFYEELNPVIRPMKKYANGQELVFENPTQDELEKYENPGLRSKITLATAGSSDTARSGMYQLVHASEVAFFPHPEETMLAILQCVPDEPNTFVCLESTANGVGGYFYDMWQQAVEGKSSFTPIFFPWFSDKNYTRPFKSEEEKQEYLEFVNTVIKDENGKDIMSEEWYLMQEFGVTLEQLNWRRYTIADKCGGDIDLFHQEYPATPEEAFIASGRPVFDMNSLRQYKLSCEDGKQGDVANGKFYENPNGYVTKYSSPVEGKNYYIGADVAEGLETGDYSAAVVYDEDANVCAKWHGHIDPDLFGVQLVDLAKYYNDAYIAVENNNHGLTTLKSITRLEYWNIFWTKVYDKINDKITEKIGWNTNRKTKPYMIDKLKVYVREKYLGLYDEEIVMEMFSYVYDEKGISNAQEGKHDDLVMASAIGIMALLEKMGQEYVPEVPYEKRTRVNRSIDFIYEDPLFDRLEDEFEVCL